MTVAEQVLAELSIGAATTSDLVKLTAKPRSDLLITLRTLHAQGLISRVGRGRRLDPFVWSSDVADRIEQVLEAEELAMTQIGGVSSHGEEEDADA